MRLCDLWYGYRLEYLNEELKFRSKCLNVHPHVVCSQWVSIFFWGLSLTTLAAVIFGPYEMIQFDHQYDVIESSIYGGVHRFAWAIAVGWIVLACSSGHGVSNTEIGKRAGDFT
uniref:Uncharacterized protein n=1 Tax=Timema genevievae TaxID=629358 RepID=A0A7R9K3D0_TIMGE|nr:unnamed protein product [Timema genevievae]